MACAQRRPRNRTPVGAPICDNGAVSTTIEVFADITCPFTHVGLKRVVEHVSEMDRPVDVIVRAWPLEWVNGTALDVAAVQVKAAALHDQLGVDDFAGLRAERWPTTTLPALELAAAAYDIDARTGLAVSLALRAALFEQGREHQQLRCARRDRSRTRRRSHQQQRQR